MVDKSDMMGKEEQSVETSAGTLGSHTVTAVDPA